MWKEKIILLVILILGFVVRLYRFDNPISGWHSWRQSDTSAVSRNFITGGFDILHPRFDDLSNVQTASKFNNPEGFRFVEFPIYNVLQAASFKYLGYFTLEQWGRLISIFASLISIVLIYLLGKNYAGKTVGFFASFAFAFLPFSIYYSRTILPDTSMVTATLAGIYFFTKFSQDSKLGKKINLLWYVFALLFSSVALLLKPYAAIFLLPLAYISIKTWKWKVVLQPFVWLFVGFSFMPLILWRIWISAFPEGIPVSYWLFNETGIRFTGAFFYWIFEERIGKLILGVWGLPIVIIGLIGKQKRDFLFFLSFIVASMLYVFILAKGNVQHDYYQILIVPTIALLFGLGASFLIHASKEVIQKHTAYIVLIISTIAMLAFSWYFVRDYFNINNPAIITTGHAVDKLIPKDAIVVAPYNGDTTLLYQINRKGYASFSKPLEELIYMGADYLVLVNPKKEDFNIGKTYKIISTTSDYILFDLHKKP